MITAFHSSRVSHALITLLFIVPFVSCGTSHEPVIGPSAAQAVIAPPGSPTPPPAPTPTVTEIASDADLFALVTKTEPFSAYRFFHRRTVR